MPEFHQAVYVISVAAELAGVHPQTLRIYERKGLVNPARTGGGSRRYSQADIELLHRIQELTNDGLNLAGVERVLELELRVAELENELARTRSEAAEAVEAPPLPARPGADVAGGGGPLQRVASPALIHPVADCVRQVVAEQFGEFRRE